ncbi:hypothetical protein AGMMS49587_13530 [Spirochaetia bacterium]|nr:hypothetical protein AGMMS49587_13530 [Spirochaetia bacterium]
MEEPRLTRPYLESLTTNELVRLANSFGIDIPPSLERVFIIGELLDVASTEYAEAEEETADVLEAADFLDSAPLPKQYNITFIEVLIRDPLWAFLFWEVKSSDKEFFQKEADFEGYCLRVNPIGNRGEAQKGNPFTVPVGNDDTAWYLGFSPGSPGENAAAHAAVRYQVELCVLRGPEPAVLAVSRVFTMPRLQPPVHSYSPAQPGKSDTAALVPMAACFGALTRLSGAEDFRVIRNADRQPRAKYGAGNIGEPSA